MAVKYYKFVCFQLYEFNTTNLYVTNQKKLAIEKNIRIRMKQHLHTERKNSKYKKRGSLLSPGMRESVNLLQKYFRHQPKKVDCTIFLYKDNPKKHLKKEILRIHLWCI